MFNLKLGFSVKGLIIYLLPMIINIVYAFYQPVNGTAGDSPQVNGAISLIENVTRVVYCLAVCFLVSDKPVDYKSPWFYIGLLFLVLYHLVWFRYFIGGRDVALLGKSFLGVPQPLAVFPIIYFICAAIWLHNMPALVIMIIFGAAHNYTSFININK